MIKRVLVVLLCGLVGMPAMAQDGATPVTIKPLESKNRLFVAYDAGSKIRDTKALGGFSTSANFPQAVGKMKVRPREIYLQANPDEAVAYGHYLGMTLLLVNTTKVTVPFSACDSCLFIVREALNPEGKWVAIETLPQTFCGNSYHRVFLKSGQFWKFKVPQYAGSFKTKMRFRFLGALPNKKSPDLVSNVFEGSIDLNQLQPQSKKRGASDVLQELAQIPPVPKPSKATVTILTPTETRQETVDVARE